METVGTNKIVTFKQTLWFSLLGGYLGGFYLISLNYEAMGYPELAKKARRTGLISIILLSVVICFLNLFAEEWTRPYISFLAIAQGVIGSVYLLHEHYKAVDKWNRWKECLVSLLFVIPLMLAPLYLPEKLLHYIPTYMCILIPALIMSQFVKSHQELHFGNLEKMAKRKLLGAMLIALALNIAIAFAIGFTISLIHTLIKI